MMQNRVKKAIGIVVLVVCMVVTMLPVPVFADPVGTEIPADAIYISTPDDLIALVENCRVNTWSVGKTVVLSNDINLTGTEFSGIPTFGGTFIGQGFSIYGVELTGEGSVVGFFRYLQKTAVVENITLAGEIHPTGSKSVIGTIAGQNEGIIRNCTYIGNISGYSQVGGIVGVNETSGLIEGCTILGTVSGSHFVGGAAGENHGVIRDSVNNSEINTSPAQNMVEIEDITLDSLTSTEDASTATNIGGITGANSGVVRACINNAKVGHQSMGYNVGGISGSQTGYMVECVNNAIIEGRKEVGGIVGHMEPNISLDYDADSLQILSAQLESLSVLIKDMQATMESGKNKIENQMDALDNSIDNIQNAIDIVTSEMQKEEPDIDIITAAMNTISDSLDTVIDSVYSLADTSEDLVTDVSRQLEGIISEMESIMEAMESMDENLDLIITDISGEDTESDTLGKVDKCINYGNVTGDQNIGGIAGILAEETDLEAYEDVAVSGDMSLNSAFQTRVVVRNCQNFGTIKANKYFAGGIAGQMLMGAILDCINMGNLDCINADYVGGIAGDSYAIIRNSSSKAIIAGETYVGGIAGSADEVKNCYAFVSIVSYSEKAGAIVGSMDELPNGNGEDTVSGNYYFIFGENVGGIDGISYTGATDEVDLEGFLQLENLDDDFRTVNITFKAEGQENVVLSVNVGETITMDDVPVLATEADSEYSWKVVPAVTSEVLGMGETASVDYISDEALTNILFDQIYEATFELKNTVIQTVEKSETGLGILLANGIFSKNTTITFADICSSDGEINGKEAIESWSVTLSNTGVQKLHYLIPEDVDTDAIKLFVKNANGEWVEREYVVDLSYIVFDFVDGETAFALVADHSGMIKDIVVVGLIVIVGCFIFGITRKKRKANTVKTKNVA